MTIQRRIAILEAQYNALTHSAPLKVKRELIAKIRELQAQA